MTNKRVAITGVGVVSPIGRGFAEFSDALRGGVSGGRTVSLFDPSAFPTRIAAEVPDFDPAAELAAALGEELADAAASHVPEQDRKTVFGLVSAVAAFRDAGLEPDPRRVTALNLGTGLSSVTLEQLEDDVLPFVGDRGGFDAAAFGRVAATRQSAAPWRHLTDEANRLIALALELSGPSVSNFSACAASLQSVGRAYRDVAAGRASVAIAGGMDSIIHPFGMISFMRLGALSTHNSDPAGASRPFDRDRDGFVLGEGGAALVLEPVEDAVARGAHIYAEILGYGTSIDAHLVTAPHPEGRGARLAMQRALAEAGVEPHRLDYINAHGTGTALNDTTESVAIRKLYGASSAAIAPVSSTKSMTGHLIAAAGAVEIIACLAAIAGDFLPPSINISTVDPECDVPVVDSAVGVEAEVRTAMTNSFGFGGQNGVLVLGECEG